MENLITLLNFRSLSFIADRFICTDLCYEGEELVAVPKTWACSTAQLSVSDCKFRGCEFEPQPVHITFVETDHEIISTAAFHFLLIKEGQLSVTGKSTSTKYWLIA